jgi:hypothetical protein
MEQHQHVNTSIIMSIISNTSQEHAVLCYARQQTAMHVEYSWCSSVHCVACVTQPLLTQLIATMGFPAEAAVMPSFNKM